MIREALQKILDSSYGDFLERPEPGRTVGDLIANNLVRKAIDGNLEAIQLLMVKSIPKSGNPGPGRPKGK